MPMYREAAKIFFSTKSTSGGTTWSSCLITTGLNLSVQNNYLIFFFKVTRKNKVPPHCNRGHFTPVSAHTAVSLSLFAFLAVRLTT